jgi:hypothetical protein
MGRIFLLREYLISLARGLVQCVASPGSYVAHALVRAASRLISTPVPRAMETMARHRHECRRGTPRACATRDFDSHIMTDLCDALN